MTGVVGATPGHAGALAAVHASCFAGADRWDTRAIADLLAMPGCFGLLHPTGGCLVARLAGGEAEILTLAVAPGARRQGVATALLTTALDRIGPVCIFLEVAVANTAAQALYARHGFGACGRRPHYYPGGGAALILRRA